MWWLIVLAFLALVAAIPLGINAVYNSKGAGVWLVVGPIRIILYPRMNDKPGRMKTKNRKISSGASADSREPQEKTTVGKFRDLLPLVRVILDVLCDFRRKLRINHLDLKLILAGDDPCDLSVNYGRAWTALGNLMPQLERLFTIKSRNLEVECDYTAEETLVDARLEMTITVGGLLTIAAFHGIRGLREYLKILKLRKGGAVK